ncbi:hypothetical protein BKA82DRAFT_28486 [Pisolithus tinctorius]|uniref:Uncharacterized protein n=1 Tax=Pisolithus tinctorius Marx 270 TaxID=870435 RepID=A0A0C3P364_PISTI|nr:hypothetical protein BKA82DRAFT_28486 [Pisolithus tinctorius]KIO01739.1 hypothetical protein M404DRAFT_28486 [Pisolithus tinctorius Marx 270]
MPSHASTSSSDPTFLHTSSTSRSSTLTSTVSSRSEAMISPIIYSHVHNLHGIVSSNYYPTSTSHIRNLAHPLGDLVACYLASHGYGTGDVECIIQAHECVHNNEDLVIFLAGQGMSVSEARFLLRLVDLQDIGLR